MNPASVPVRGEEERGGRIRTQQLYQKEVRKRVEEELEPYNSTSKSLGKGLRKNWNPATVCTVLVR